MRVPGVQGSETRFMGPKSCFAVHSFASGVALASLAT
jgi:hypothetical protein